MMDNICTEGIQKLNLINILAPLYQKGENDNVNYDELAKLYFISKKEKSLMRKVKLFLLQKQR